MEDIPFTHYMEHLIRALARIILLAVVLPLIPVFIFNLSLPATLALMTSTFMIEYGAAPIGIGLGLHPLYVLFILICIAIGVTLFLFDIFDALGEHSERVAKFLEKSGERAKQSKILSKYGIYGLVPCVMTLGFYVCGGRVGLWLAPRCLHPFDYGGNIAISLVTVLLSLGIFDLLFR